MLFFEILKNPQNIEKKPTNETNFARTQAPRDVADAEK